MDLPADWRTHHKILVQSDAEEKSDMRTVTDRSQISILLLKAVANIKEKSMNLKHLSKKILGLKI